jgi:hypothetical protein
MEGEHSPVPKKILASEMEVPRLEATATGSSSGGDSGDRFEGGSGGHDEESGAVDPREAEHSYDFEPSTVTVGHIRQLEALGYCVEGFAREPGEEVVLDPGDDEAVVFEEFFAAGLRMPLQPTLTDILLKFRVQLHQLTPNAFAQFFKYFWVVLSFGSKPSGDGFVKRYELHYQSKKVDADRVEKYQQFGCINFHARRGIGAKLTLAIKNKWYAGWMKAWFYCKVHAHVCAQGGELCITCIRTCVVLTFRRSPLSIAVMMTRGMSHLSEPPNLLEVRTPWRSLWPTVCTL